MQTSDEKQSKCCKSQDVKVLKVEAKVTNFFPRFSNHCFILISGLVKAKTAVPSSRLMLIISSIAACMSWCENGSGMSLELTLGLACLLIFASCSEKLPTSWRFSDYLIQMTQHGASVAFAVSGKPSSVYQREFPTPLRWYDWERKPDCLRCLIMPCHTGLKFLSISFRALHKNVGLYLNALKHMPLLHNSSFCTCFLPVSEMCRTRLS